MPERAGNSNGRDRGAGDTVTRECPHGDTTCPCQDGDICHYEPTPEVKAMRCPRTGRTDGGCCRG